MNQKEKQVNIRLNFKQHRILAAKYKKYVAKAEATKILPLAAWARQQLLES